MNNATIEKQTPDIVEASPDIYNPIMPPGKGLIDWDAFIQQEPENQLIRTVRAFLAEYQIETPLSHLQVSQLRDIEQGLSTWVRREEKLLSRDNTGIRKKFVALANRWHEETDYLSSPLRITDNDAYLKIISMGEAVIPLILEDLRERGGNWYRALRILSDEDPVSPPVRGEVPKMKEAWLRWGRDKGYIK
ncbi:MAG: hypothetical protein HY528_02255 [Chloroflexi bacterium]|nr:hypothetical protein [Chloroflexota bacterium]